MGTTARDVMKFCNVTFGCIHFPSASLNIRPRQFVILFENPSENASELAASSH